MILNWKNTGVRGYHARVQIVARYLADGHASGGPSAAIQIVNILIEDDLGIQIEVREEGGAGYDWPAFVDPFAEGSKMVDDEGESVMMACVEDWLDRLAEAYHVYEVEL